MDELKKLLKDELGFLPEGDGMDRLLERGDWFSCPGRTMLVEAGKKATDVLIVREGIVRFWDMDGDKERTFAFGLPGSLMQNKHSFVMHLPSYFNVETCCPTTILRISEKDFWEVVNSDHSLTLWMLHYAYGELFFQEHKNSKTHNGTAWDRFKAMLGDRPMIMEKVPQRIVASYLGITPEYFSSLKRRFLRERK
ncbi:MAG: cyclic nucleotide-binding domain-containing protein [Lachnospiraceae bacterium]|nr:cyclic nucleotide-binding domain-containing protein [Prevotella sp.]MCM1075633.1 cyclic nucleotide-binding domain-containing protein [Ruminococcus sp.]MCM1223578.1 cyclic nucleotide-binding domain-containing protein [Lachnospiraceae bacterium]